jgi:hypothetical protein
LSDSVNIEPFALPVPPKTFVGKIKFDLQIWKNKYLTWQSIYYSTETNFEGGGCTLIIGPEEKSKMFIMSRNNSL